MKPSLILPFLLASGLHAQPTPAAPAASGIAKLTESLATSAPTFHPGTELVTWNGQTWSITNNRIFESQFEKYLNTPETSALSSRTYRQVLSRIEQLLAPGRVTPAAQDEAFKLLSLAASSDEDGNMSDVLANQIYLSWLAQNNTGRLGAANQALETERKRLEWNLQMAAKPNSLSGGGSFSVGKSGASAQNPTEQALEKSTKIQPITTRLAEVNLMLKSNNARSELSLAQAKAEFQALLVQMIMQRRFEHATIGIKFYRSIFADGTGQVKLGEEASGLFSKTTGSPPTLATLEAMSREMMHSAREGIKAFQVMMASNQTHSASKRLAEAYMVGQYLPDITAVPLTSKQKVLVLTQKTSRLISAIDMKDYGQAEKLLAEVKALAPDLDASKASAGIETAKMAASMRLAKARNAAVSGDRPALESELQAAAEIWPTNPQLQEMASTIFAQADVQARALADFNQLLTQKNYRQIYDEKMRFIATTSMLPEKQEQLRLVLDDMTAIEGAILRAQEIERRGDYAGAWEGLEAIFSKFPSDNKLSQVRANLTTKASDYVNALRKAEELEKQEQPGSALAAYLEARKIYPPSQFAREGIVRLSAKIMPDSQ